MGAETLDRVLVYWRAWEAEGGAPVDVAIVTIGRERFVRAPARLRPRLTTDAPVDLASLLVMLGDDVDTVVGEARLAYADEATLRLVAAVDAEDVGDDDPRLAALGAAADPSEWSEGSVAEPCQRRVAITRDESLLAVATLRVWDDVIGHVGVFTAAEARRGGLACKVSSAAVRDALTLGCVPQWRSRVGNDASARVGDRLGFVAAGHQMFLRLRPRC